MGSNTPQDSEIITQILSGDSRAFALLLDRHKEKGMTLAVRMLKSREEAEEALQDAFIRAYKALPRFEWKSSFPTYFHRIVFNVCATRLKRRDPNLLSTFSIDDDEPVSSVQLSSDSMPDIDYDAAEFRTILLEEIEHLDPLLASLLTLFLENDLSYDEIVAVTDLPLGTVKNRLFRGRMLLRSAVLKRYEEVHST